MPMLYRVEMLTKTSNTEMLHANSRNSNLVGSMFLRWCQSTTDSSCKLVCTNLRCGQGPDTFLRGFPTCCSSHLRAYNTQPPCSDWSLTPAQHQCNLVSCNNMLISARMCTGLYARQEGDKLYCTYG